jgi:hypothetical protein
MLIPVLITMLISYLSRFENPQKVSFSIEDVPSHFYLVLVSIGLMGKQGLSTTTTYCLLPIRIRKHKKATQKCVRLKTKHKKHNAQNAVTNGSTMEPYQEQHAHHADTKPSPILN